MLHRSGMCSQLPSSVGHHAIRTEAAGTPALAASAVIGSQSAARRTRCSAGATRRSCACEPRAWPVGFSREVDQLAALAATGRRLAPGPTRSRQPTHDRQTSTSKAPQQPNCLDRYQDAPDQPVTLVQPTLSNGVLVARGCASGQGAFTNDGVHSLSEGRAAFASCRLFSARSTVST